MTPPIGALKKRGQDFEFKVLSPFFFRHLISKIVHIVCHLGETGVPGDLVQIGLRVQVACCGDMSADGSVCVSVAGVDWLGDHSCRGAGLSQYMFLKSSWSSVGAGVFLPKTENSRSANCWGLPPVEKRAHRRGVANLEHLPGGLRSATVATFVWNVGTTPAKSLGVTRFHGPDDRHCNLLTDHLDPRCGQERFRRFRPRARWSPNPWLSGRGGHRRGSGRGTSRKLSPCYVQDPGHVPIRGWRPSGNRTAAHPPGCPGRSSSSRYR